VDPEIEAGVALRRVDAQCRRLLAALVPACRLAGVEGSEQALGEGETGIRLIGRGRVVHHPLARQHVAGDRVARACARPAPADAIPPAMLGDAAAAVDQVELAMLAALVGADEAAHDLLGLDLGREELEAVRSEQRIDEGLRGKRPNPAPRMGAERADGEEAGGDGDTESTGFRVVRHDRPGHGGVLFRSASPTKPSAEAAYLAPGPALAQTL